MVVRLTLNETLERLNTQGKTITRNAIAVQARIRPTTLSEMVHHKTQSIRLDTLDAILNAMNYLLPGENFTIKDIVDYEYDESQDKNI